MSIAPTRIIDTRDGTGVPATPITPFGTLTVDVGGGSSSGIAAVVMNVTVAAPTSAGYLTVYPGGTSRPLASNLNFGPGQNIPNLVVAPLGPDGTVSFYSGSGGSIDLVADVSGYYLSGTPTQPGTFHPLAPSRLLDTREGNGAPQGFVSPNGTVALQAEGRGGIPASGVSAVILNVTVTGPQAPGYITVYGDGTTQPLASNLNFGPGQTVPNLVMAPVGPDGKVDLFNGSTGGTHLVADVFGYVLAGSPTNAGAMQSLAPTRILDTRNGTGAPAGPVDLGGIVQLQATGVAGVPSDGVSAVVLNVTVTQPKAQGHIAAYGDMNIRPLASNLNFLPNQTVPNLVVAPVDSTGRVTLFNGSVGTTHLIADITGYYLSGGGTVMAIGSGAGLGNDTVDISPEPVRVNAATGITTLAGQPYGGYAIDAEGRVWAWGGNYYGQPLLLDNVPPAVAIASDAGTVYLVAADGTVWAWGEGEQGQLGDGLNQSSETPSQVPGLTNIVAVAAGSDWLVALRSDGTVWAWGTDDDGQLGNGLGHPAASTPVQIAALNNVTAIAAGAYAGYALRSDGTVWSWGGGPGGYGEVGTGFTGVGALPAQISNLANVTDICAKVQTAYALHSDGTVSSWGWNLYDELGDGSSVYASPTPVHVASLNDAVAITANGYTAYALRADGTVVGWGFASSSFPELGTATNIPSNVPVPIAGLANVTAIAAGADLYALVGVS